MFGKYYNKSVVDFNGQPVAEITTEGYYILWFIKIKTVTVKTYQSTTVNVNL